MKQTLNTIYTISAGIAIIAITLLFTHDWPKEVKEWNMKQVDMVDHSKVIKSNGVMTVKMVGTDMQFTGLPHAPIPTHHLKHMTYTQLIDWAQHNDSLINFKFGKLQWQLCRDTQCFILHDTITPTGLHGWWEQRF